MEDFEKLIAIDAGADVSTAGAFLIVAKDQADKALAILLSGPLLIRVLSAITEALPRNAPELAPHLANSFEALAKALRSHPAPERH